MVWVERTDQASGRIYYYNTATGESSWTPPAATATSAVATATALPPADWNVVAATEAALSTAAPAAAALPSPASASSAAA